MSHGRLIRYVVCNSVSVQAAKVYRLPLKVYAFLSVACFRCDVGLVAVIGAPYMEEIQVLPEQKFALSRTFFRKLPLV